MTTRQLARVILRLHGLLFLGTVCYECMNLATDYRTFVSDALTPESAAYGSRIFWLGVLRTVTYATVALLLLLMTDRVIAFLGGKQDGLAVKE